jgi:hypothetical protein
LLLKNEPFRQEEFRRKISMDYFGKQIYVVSPEDLIISKLIWIQELQSSVQIEDIKSLVEIETLDWPYINEWVKTLKLATFGLLKK